MASVGERAESAGNLPALRGLVIDWGGVLTASLDGAMAEWADREGVDFAHYRDVMAQWVGRRDSGARPDDETVAAATAGRQGSGEGVSVVEGVSVAELEQSPDAGPAGISPVHRLERGEMPVAEFETVLAAELSRRGSPVPAPGLLGRLLAGLGGLDERMIALVWRVRSAGLRTALLSNSWGDHYPEELWEGLFDDVVISGRVGLRKPEARIFTLTAERLGLPVAACVMVDDLPGNVYGAVAAGMVGVLHRSYEETAAELEALLGVSLS